MGVERTQRGHAAMAESDPIRTSVVTRQQMSHQPPLSGMLVLANTMLSTRG